MMNFIFRLECEFIERIYWKFIIMENVVLNDVCWNRYYMWCMWFENEVYF